MKLSAWTKHFLVYGLGVVLMNLPQVLLIPIYTNRVPPSVYGVLELLNRSQEILLLILSFGLRSALLTFFQMASDEPDRQKNVYSTAIQFLCTFGMVCILLMTIGSSLWSQLLFGTKAYAAAVVLILLATYFEMVFQMTVLYLQSNLKSIQYVTVFSTRTLLAIALNLLFVYWWRWGLMGILWATLLHTAIYAAIVLVYMFHRTGFAFDRKALGEMVRFGLPVMIGGFAGFLLNSGDRYFLNIYVPRAEVGLYGLGYKIGTLSMLLVLMPFGKIWSVTMVDISKKSDGPRELGKIATYLLCACTFSTLGLSVLGPYLVRFTSERSYWDAYRVIPIVGAAYIFYSWTTIMDASFYVTKRTVYKVYSISIAGAVVMLLYWVLIPRYGMMGAAWATLGGYAVFAAFTAVYAQRVYFIHYEPGRIALLFGIGLLFYWVGTLVPVVPIARGLVLRSAITLLYLAALWFGGFLRPDERKALVESWNSLRSQYFGHGRIETVPQHAEIAHNGNGHVTPRPHEVHGFWRQNGSTLRADSKLWAKRAVMRSGALRLASHLARRNIVVLYYHSIQDDPGRFASIFVPGIVHSSRLFQQQMEFISQRFNPVSMDDIERFLRGEGKLPARPVAVTFDDGYADNFKIAVPILNRVGIQALFNIVVGAVEGPRPPWFCRLHYAFMTTRKKCWVDSVEKLPHLIVEPADRMAAFRLASQRCAKAAGAEQAKIISTIEEELDVEALAVEACPMMSWYEMRQLHKYGHLIGSHTLTHPNLAYVDDEIQRKEILESKAQLENQLGIPIHHFSYPNPIMQPNFSSLTVRSTKEAGYMMAATMMTGAVRAGHDPHLLPRVPAPSNMDEFIWATENTFLGRRI